MAEKAGSMIRKIAITGPESTGKSWLAENLATRFNTLWVPEYARQYLDEIGRHYHYADILTIAKGQIMIEQKMLKNATRFLFSDTELIVTKIWSEVKFGVCDPWIIDRIEKQHYDYFLLCDIDLPWEYDPLREDPDRRQFLFDLYFQELDNRKFPFSVISGNGVSRLEMAVDIINGKFK
jgi:NadR type nicotinamide-nucleotide adenylyltransferase